MKLISVCSPSHEVLRDEWLLPTLKDDYEVCIHPCDVRGEGRYLEEDWTRAILFKCGVIIEAIQDNWGDVFVYSDVDVTFFGPTKAAILTRLADKDIVCQLDDPFGNLCTGFFGIRANDATLGLWREVHEAVQRERRDQLAFNRLVRERGTVRAGYLPASFFGPGTFGARVVRRDERFYVPANAVMFHANFAIGLDRKMRLLARTRRLVERHRWRRWVNNAASRAVGTGNARTVESLIGQDRLQPVRRAPARVTAGSFSRPPAVALDLATACQLKCPSCPTATGEIARSLGSGFLTFEAFKTFVGDHPWVSDIELSNWGEVFLNPDLERILRYGHERRVALRIDNGANLDRASDRALEALVRYRLRQLTCSIDAATQEVYAVYRVRGDLERVLAHIRQINVFKGRYRSPYPVMRWQFVAFGHNTHEIDQAREIARDLGMDFHVKLSWDDLYADTFSPVTDRDAVRKASRLGVASRREYEETFRRHYLGPACHQLWLRPRINLDGRLLGCSVNYWDDFGNVFTDGLEACLDGDKMKRTREVLMGLRPADESTPCQRCKVYQSRRANAAWVSPEDLIAPHTPGRRMSRLIDSLPHPGLAAIARRLHAGSRALLTRMP
jgi:MoaA/NifB/PqqE/SkfB family radical SAM enzyme